MIGSEVAFCADPVERGAKAAWEGISWMPHWHRLGFIPVLVVNAGSPRISAFCGEGGEVLCLVWVTVGCSGCALFTDCGMGTLGLGLLRLSSAHCLGWEHPGLGLVWPCSVHCLGWKRLCLAPAELCSLPAGWEHLGLGLALPAGWERSPGEPSPPSPPLHGDCSEPTILRHSQ